MRTRSDSTLQLEITICDLKIRLESKGCGFEVTNCDLKVNNPGDQGFGQWDDTCGIAGLIEEEESVTINNDIVKRTVLAPGNAARLRAGELVSVELGADEHIQWIWCHHGERGSSVIGYTVGPREAMSVPEKQAIGFFSLEERR